jgi:hypothetical protein
MHLALWGAYVMILKSPTSFCDAVKLRNRLGCSYWSPAIHTGDFGPWNMYQRSDCLSLQSWRANVVKLLVG